MSMVKLHWEKIFVAGYEEVFHVTCPEEGFSAALAIHTMFDGRSLGGTRVIHYEDFDQALRDALRLSRAMTYKSVMAGGAFGGAKSVVMLGPGQRVTERLLEVFAQAVNELEGRYICAEDSGLTLDHMALLRKYTPHVVGVVSEDSSGNPSRFTAWTTFLGVRAACEALYESTSIRGKKVAIQGLGAVGMLFADLLFWHGADLIVTDLREEALKKAVLDFDATVVLPDEIYDIECDIFAPCALGGVLSKETIPRLKADIVCGCANNQLLEKEDAQLLHERDILYVPDYIANSGGLINVRSEKVLARYSAKVAREETDEVFERLREVFFLARKEKISPADAADHIVAERIFT